MVRIMRIMLDTNVLISALLFPSARMNAMMHCILAEHRMILSSYVVDELKYVVQRKFPTRIGIVDQLLTGMNYEYVYTPQKMDENMFDIRDYKDYPVLFTAMVEDVDILITGDKDFLDVDVDFPDIMTPSEFMDCYCKWTGTIKSLDMFSEDFMEDGRQQPDQQEREDMNFDE